MGRERAAESASQQGQRRTVPSSRRVLLATDFSELAERAVPWAYALAGSGGTVILTHVVEPETSPNPMYAHYEPGHAPSRTEHDARLAEVRERLRAVAPVGAAREGVATEVEVVESTRTAEGIRDVAERCRADAICLASHHRGRVGRALLGSISEALLRDVDLPLFIVPGPQD